ncbi:MAG: RagB/SusD family nutrient uptake outer membrane protein [Flavihumibacter sp.]
METASPQNKIEDKLVFDNDVVAMSAVNGLYGYNFISSSYHDTYKWLYTGYSADEIQYYTLSTNIDQFATNDILNSNTVCWDFWKVPYKAIYQSNLIIEGFEKSAVLSAAVKREGVAVAKFFRALNYLNLVTAFGDVPLILASDLESSKSMARTNAAEVYKQIVKDLQDAKEGLQGNTNGNVYVNEKSATALLARTYLYNRQWQEAADASAELITGPLNGGLALENISNVFLRSSKETILAISSNGSSTTYINYTYAGSITVPATSAIQATYQLTNSLLNAFEENDLRRTAWVGTVGTPETFFPYKYKQKSPPLDAAMYEDQVLIRLAEMYLIRAEANAQLGNLAEAASDLNAIRNRAGLYDLATDLSQADLLLAVEQERRVELFAEYGHRWADLVRTGRADAVLGAYKPDTWKSTDALYPIYFKEFEYNGNLTQNPGYER